MRGKSLVAFAVIVFSITALACSLSSGATAPKAPATVKAVATEVKSAVSTSAPAASPTAVKPGGATPPSSSGSSDDKPLSLSSRQAGLDKLKSYRMKWLAEWKSTDSSSAESASWNWVEEYSSNPQALHWMWQLTDSKDKSKNLNMEWWQIGNTTYMLTKDASGKGQCISFSSDDQKNQLTKGLFSPNALGSVSNAKFVGAETVNGLKTRHYKYDEKAVAIFASGKVNGDIWVAVDGEFAVKEIMNWSGVAGLFGIGSNAKGDGKWTWEITDVDQPIAIKAPDGCGGEASDIPVMADATDKARFGDTTSYTTPSKLADVVKFYQKEMPAAGWKVEGDTMITDELAQLQYVKGDKKAQIMISVDQGKTQVLITVGD
jgi:hypothetical protein